MRIKEIRLNGVRGYNYLKDDAGVPAPHSIKLDNKHLFLYGENGTGKSSFCDAVEWCLTGDLVESGKRKIYDYKDFLKNKFCTEEDNPFVEIELSKEDHTTITIRREFNGRRLISGFEEEAIASIIESSRIENFVIDTKSSMWERFSTLLGFEKLIIFDKQLSRLNNEASKLFETSKQNVIQRDREVRTLVEEITGLEDNFRNEIGNDWSNNIDQETNEDKSKFDGFGTLDRDLADYRSQYEEFYKLIEERESIDEQLSRENRDCNQSNISRLIDESYSYFKDNFKGISSCPVCGSNIKADEVYRRLSDFRSSLSNLLALEKRFDELIHQLDSVEKTLDKLEGRITASYQELYEERVEEMPTHKDFRTFIGSKSCKINEDKDKLFKTMSLARKFASYHERKKRLAETIDLFEKGKTDLSFREKINNDINQFNMSYIKMYSEMIKHELESIFDEEISIIYNALNQSNEEIVEKFIIEPNIDAKEITFSMLLKGLTQRFNALEVLSTGHLRCLGFALLIARIKVKVKDLQFIIIDDPIYSIDHEHRYNLIQYLIDLGQTYQLIITSSDRLFYDIIRNRFNKSKFQAYNTYLTHSDGITNYTVKRNEKQYIDEAYKHLHAKDYRAASLYARLSLETKLFDIARQLKLSIPINRFEKITIKDLIESNIRGKLNDKYSEKRTAIDREFSKLLTHRYFRSLLDGFPLDEEVHHPHETRNIYSYNEIESAIRAIGEFNEFMDSLEE